MSDEIRTTADLLNRARDGQARRSLTPQLLRDVIVTLDVATKAGVNIKSAPYLATGDNVAVDNLNSALVAGQSNLVYIPSPAVIAYLLNAQHDVKAKTILQGTGRGALLRTATTGINVLGVIAQNGVLIRDLSIAGVKNGLSGVIFNASDGTVENVEIVGLSDMSLRAQASDHIRFFKNYIHDQTGDTSMGNTCDIAFYTNSHYGIAAFNRLMGGASTELGILLQLNSTKHLIIGNEIGAHASYGIIDYDTTPRSTWSIIALNRVEDISGADFGGSKGAGIYAVQTGGQLIALNQIANTNIGTSVESLAPGAIGISLAFSPMLAIGNMINAPVWYGVKVVSSTSAIVELAHNIIFEPLRHAHYVHNASHVLINGGTVTMLTAVPLTKVAYQINTTGGGPFKNVTVNSAHVRGSARAFDVNVTDFLGVLGCNISEVNGIACKVANGIGGRVCNNSFDATTHASATALDINNMTYSVFSGNILSSNGTTKVAISGTNTGSVYDQTNVIVGQANPMNFINNTGAGCKVTQYGTAAPTLCNHQIGDRVINSAPAVGTPKAWSCTVAGLPGTWVSEGNL